jgi:threonine dehydrogenase-like Zn-dependent dehydrogenase
MERRRLTLARSLWLLGAGSAAIREQRIEPPGEGSCRVEALFSSISPGTERLVAAGRVPREVHSEMRCPYMEGEFSFPLKYGYSVVGEVSEGPAALQGQLVHVLHPHQDRFNVRIDDVFALPPSVPARRATLASNLETAVNALWDSAVTLGERAVVVGFGIVGSLVARLLSFMPGVDVSVIDPSPEKIALASEMGFSAAASLHMPGLADLAFHCSGAPAGLATALDSVGQDGRVIELSWYGDTEVRLSLGGTFHSGRKRIIGSQVSRIAAHQLVRWTLRRRKELVFSLLARPELDRHITRSVAFPKLADFFDELRTGDPRGLSVLVEYR